MTNNQLDNNLQSAHYSMLSKAYLTSQMEIDKSFLFLSFLFTCLTCYGIGHITNINLLFCFVFSNVFFISCIILILYFIWPHNSKLVVLLLEEYSQNNTSDAYKKEMAYRKKLKFFDKMCKIFFAIGLFFVCLFIIQSANINFFLLGVK